MAPLLLPPHVMERLKQANINRLSSGCASDYVLNSGVERVDKDEDPGLMSQMRVNGFPKAFCEFTLDFLGKLKEEKAQPLPPTDASRLARHGFSMDNCDNLVEIVRSMNDYLVRSRNFGMRMNQVAALLTLIFGSSNEVWCRAYFSK